MKIKWNRSSEGLPLESGRYLVAKHMFDDYQGGPPYYDVMTGYYSAGEGLWYLDCDDIDRVRQAHLEHVDTNSLDYISHWAERPDPPEDDRC